MQMNKPDKVIDISAWAGNWAFRELRYGKLPALKQRLSKYNIVKAYVSPIEAILMQDPMKANLDLCKSIDNLGDGFFSPVPVIDLSFNNWEEIVELAVRRNDIRIVKLLPNYHMYELTEGKLAKLVEYGSVHKLIISIQMRIEDLRGQYPLMKVPDVDVMKVIKVLSGFPDQTFIINNCYIHEIEQVLYSLENAYADISSAEIQDVLSYLNQKYNSDKLLFSTHSAFYFPEGNVFKLNYSGLDTEDLNKIAFKNAESIGL
jgi:predicted TIM-barrel fold metal-dependent hydrolase